MVNYIIGAPSSGTRWLFNICSSYILKEGFHYIHTSNKEIPDPHNTPQLANQLKEEDKVIHIVRNGKDSIASRIKAGHGQDNISHIQKDDRKHIMFAHSWTYLVEEALKFRGDKRYLEIKYEELVLDIEKTYTKIVQFVELPFDWEKLTTIKKSILENAKTEMIGRCRELNQNQIEEILPIIKSTMIKLGYIK